jgi:magnesium-transporting ATPase (P-type)
LKAPADPADVIRQIDVHTVPVDVVYHRYSTSPTLGLESPAVERLTQNYGKNVISPPKTIYWKKALNYVFGGFNFLMWIAFIVTLVSLGRFDSLNSRDSSTHFLLFFSYSFRTSLSGIPIRLYLTWV